MVSLFLNCIDLILYAYMIISVGYILVFALAAHIKKDKHSPSIVPQQLNRFVILIPAYKEDRVIHESVSSALSQDYPSHLYNTIVISDQMTKETNASLKEAGAEVLTITFKESSKAKALNFAADYLNTRTYDNVLILDADNIIPHTYLQDINELITHTKYKAIQTHRKAKNQNTDIATLDAIIEEMNNNIFRTGHVNLGFSSALIGSGMAFDYQWFLTNIKRIKSAGEDKEFEELLLRQRIHIGYADHITVWDEKVQQKEAIQHQRRRWIATQFFLASLMWKHLPKAILDKNGDYILKAIQTIIFPRSILLAVLIVAIIVTSFLSFALSIKWWGILLVYLVALYIAIPHSMRNKQLLKAIRNVPYFIFIMVLNLFHLKGAGMKFIHTKHG